MALMTGATQWRQREGYLRFVMTCLSWREAALRSAAPERCVLSRQDGPQSSMISTLRPS